MIRKWYFSQYESDELKWQINPSATFRTLSKNLPNVYEYIGVEDSIVRERIFTELANRMNVDYDVVYNKWLYGNN